MKRLIQVLFVVAMLTVLIFGYGTTFSNHANAVTYQPWEYAAIQFSKLGTVEAVDASFFKFAGDYAAAHQGCWDACYQRVATEWMNAHGCASCYIQDNQLSFKLKVDVPVYAPSNVTVPSGNPEPWMYALAATYDSGYMDAKLVQASFYASQVAYAQVHQGCWQECYEAVATEWLDSHGCSGCFISNNQLSFKLRSDPKLKPKME